jgi:hypothetical protein
MSAMSAEGADLKVSWRAFEQITTDITEVSTRLVGARPKVDTEAAKAVAGLDTLTEALDNLGRVLQRAIDETEAQVERDVVGVREVVASLRGEELAAELRARTLMRCTADVAIPTIAGIPLSSTTSGLRLEPSPSTRRQVRGLTDSVPGGQ